MQSLPSRTPCSCSFVPVISGVLPAPLHEGRLVRESEERNPRRGVRGTSAYFQSPQVTLLKDTEFSLTGSSLVSTPSRPGSQTERNGQTWFFIVKTVASTNVTGEGGMNIPSRHTGCLQSTSPEMGVNSIKEHYVLVLASRIL